ncbi:uncharacterized protein LOC114536365 [Dendronephthya gigantea]|uniref:uncharacterized protein LOC114536365 n=1 Tax=Dendronephthya gigantea TaxID=151771 RepID=UPI00106A5214|nr:uncharacterized protein LOC114536365 [Dendronephthya gigantea]
MDATRESDVFKKMTVVQIKNFLLARGVSVTGYDKITLIKIGAAVERMCIPLLPTLTNDRKNGAANDERLSINDMEIENPFKMSVMNNFIDSPSFGLYNIFNYLIFHSTAYDKQGLAAYKSFDDYSLFEDGHVESLMTKTLNNERLHVYVAKVRPAMKVKTDDGKPCYDLWFILEGHGPNRGSVLKAKCMCKGGRDGGCKHIGAVMYSLEEVLNTRSKDSVTSGSCVWVKKASASTKACEVSDLVIEKPKLPSYKLRKRDHAYSQNIDVDVRAHKDQKPIKKRKLRRLTGLMKLMKQRPTILPVLQKRYCAPKKSPTLLTIENGDKSTSGTSSSDGIIKHKEIDDINQATKRKFLGASLDNIKTCQCASNCPDVVVEYKCPWKHKDMHPKKTFLTPEIGGIEKDKTFCLTKSSAYYHQIQAQMFVSELFHCDFVVWTSQGIFVLPVSYDAAFMDHVCNQLELFWKAEVLPCMMADSNLNVANTVTGDNLDTNKETAPRVTNNNEHSVSPMVT